MTTVKKTVERGTETMILRNERPSIGEILDASARQIKTFLDDLEQERLRRVTRAKQFEERTDQCITGVQTVTYRKSKSQQETRA